MKLISHRGNINGRIESYENEPTYIDNALNNGYDVEVDVWYNSNQPNILFLGHDEPQYGVPFSWFIERNEKLWVHCKNIEAVIIMQTIDSDVHYFWHQKDDITLTSQNILWTYPGCKLTDNSVCVMPECIKDTSQETLNNLYAICSDNIKDYKKYK